MAQSVFGETAAGEAVHRLMIGAGDLSVALLTHGATICDVRLAGVPHSLTVGSPDLAAYEGPMASCGAVMGPVANRLAEAAAVIDGVRHAFDGAHPDGYILHSGAAGFHRRIWQVAGHDPASATLILDAADGAGGFPGNRRITARFEVAAPATLRLTLQARTDAPTLMNLANHSYWRLDDAPTTEGHVLRIAADSYLPLSTSLIPTGEVRPVAGTRLDFREGRIWTAGAEGTVDNNFCLSRARRPLRPVAWLTGRSGIRLEMATTEPGLQIYDGAGLDLPQFAGNDGAPPVPYCGIAMEAQAWPDAPNHADFPSILLRPGEDWTQVTEWRLARG